MSQTTLNPEIMAQFHRRLQTMINEQLDLLESSRAGVDDVHKVHIFLKQASDRVQRRLSLLQLNERLNRLRDTVAQGEDPASDLSRSSLMRLGVDAGLAIAKAAALIEQAREDGRRATPSP